MIYIYDVLVNFGSNKEVIYFYEWEKEDNIEYLKKSLLIKVTDYIYKKLVSNNIVVSDEILSAIHNKSEILNERKVEYIKYFCLFTNGLDVTGLEFDSNGNIIRNTKFTLQDELELLEIAKSLKIKKISYKKILNNEYNHLTITREGQRIIQSIKENLEKVKNEKEIVNYLYYEWFECKNNLTDKYKKLITDIEKSYTEKHNEFLKLLKLISVNNNV